MPREWAETADSLPCLNPRIVFRDVVHSSNTRKIWAALAPSEVLLTNKAPFLLFPRGDIEAQAYLLGVFNSSVGDWFGHLRVNLNLNFFIFNSVPVPVYKASDASRRLVELSAFLALPESPDPSLKDWQALAGEVQASRDEALVELDALVSLMYGIPDQLLDEIFSLPTRPGVEDVRLERRRWESAFGRNISR